MTIRPIQKLIEQRWPGLNYEVTLHTCTREKRKRNCSALAAHGKDCIGGKPFYRFKSRQGAQGLYAGEILGETRTLEEMKNKIHTMDREPMFYKRPES